MDRYNKGEESREIKRKNKYEKLKEWQVWVFVVSLVNSLVSRSVHIEDE